MLKSVPILCRFKNLSVVLCVTLWYSNFSICLKLTHIVTYGNILEYLKPFLAGHQEQNATTCLSSGCVFCFSENFQKKYLINIQGQDRRMVRREYKMELYIRDEGYKLYPSLFDFNQSPALKVHKYKKDFEHINHNQSPVIVGKL